MPPQRSYLALRPLQRTFTLPTCLPAYLPGCPPTCHLTHERAGAFEICYSLSRCTYSINFPLHKPPVDCGRIVRPLKPTARTAPSFASVCIRRPASRTPSAWAPADVSISSAPRSPARSISSRFRHSDPSAQRRQPVGRPMDWLCCCFRATDIDVVVAKLDRPEPAVQVERHRKSHSKVPPSARVSDLA